jgi:hypothetical protein
LEDTPPRRVVCPSFPNGSNSCSSDNLFLVASRARHASPGHASLPKSRIAPTPFWRKRVFRIAASWHPASQRRVTCAWLPRH